MNTERLAIFFKDLSNMLLSGIGLEHSLRTLGETALEGPVRCLCAGAWLELERGVSLKDALEISGVLPREALMAVSAGEQAGDLPAVLLMLGEYFELRSEIRKKIFSALGYPVIVIGILLCVFLYMAFEVVPKVAVFLPSGAMEAPLTAGLVTVAAFLKDRGGVVAGVCVFLLAGILLGAYRRPDIVRAIISRVPLIGDIVKDEELLLGFFTLYILQKSGLPLSQALREAAGVAGGITGRHMESCVAYLAGGLTFSEAVRREGYFPGFTADTLRIGEESGRFEEYFERLYKTFYRSFQVRMEYLSVAVRPALLVVAAGFIALIAIGFLQPLYGNLTAIGN